ncbi:BCCT family transporter [Paenibacillus sp. N1-5-1-14]|uniref:glycine betaine uptake BCCT transporter n=1 Tax=Paenibacillus radicibacter TaxID=2972488 RepID=UPI0021591BF6|nr:BCCT family transporter [Paenibacillus radicibacter]MCR8643554.1 BCCT family transporter [Paenibacillus radicibacter]
MVFYISVVIVLAFVVWGIVSPDVLADKANDVLAITTTNFGWFYLLSTFVMLIFVFYLAFSKYGNIRLGKDEDRPKFSNLSWFSMLFSAGMGIGLVFWGVAEPMSHYLSPPMGADPESPEAARLAMQYSFFHWGLHPWAIYALIGLSLAYFQFRKGRKGLISQTFYPILKERVNGPIGKTIDVLAIIATTFGVATSLGLGTLQINGGLAHIINVPFSITSQIIIIVVVTFLYMLSALTGLDKGIKILSNVNLLFVLGLLILTLLFGPTIFILDTFTLTLGRYLQNLVQMSLSLTPFSQGSWVSSWTLFYWAWWISWGPFVGMFIARISKGRTIREFILGVLVIPSSFSFLWFSVFGGTAMHLEMFKNVRIAEAVKNDMTVALFVTLEQLPLGYILAIIATILIITFFITSADSATFVLGMLSSKGSLNPSSRVKLIWGILQSSIAIVLLLSQGLQALQTASIVSALPFAIIMIFMGISLLKSLQAELD